MKKSSQINLIKFNKDLAFGGSRGNSKTARPICTKRPMHLIMKSNCAKGSASMAKIENNAQIRAIITCQSKKFGVRVSKIAILSNHFHAIVFATQRRMFQNFLRAVASLIARLLLPKTERLDKFWAGLAFTRVTEWGKALRILEQYLLKNQFEADGFPTEVAVSMAKQSRPNRRTQ